MKNREFLFCFLQSYHSCSSKNRSVKDLQLPKQKLRGICLATCFFAKHVSPQKPLPNIIPSNDHRAEGVDWRSSGKGEKETQVLEQLAEFRWLALSDQLWTASAVATFRALDVEHCLGTTWHLFFWYVQWLLTAFLCLTRSLPKKLEVRQEVSNPCCWDKICVYSKIRSVKKGEPPLIQLSACTGRSCIWKKALLSTCQCFAFPLHALLLEKWVKPQNCV